MQPQNRLEIILHHTPTWWLAEFRGSIVGKLREIAGVDTVATGFNGHIPGSVVCGAMATLNPDAIVRLAPATACDTLERAGTESPGAISRHAAARNVPSAPGKEADETAAATQMASDKPNTAQQLLTLASEIVLNCQREPRGAAVKPPAPADTLGQVQAKKASQQGQQARDALERAKKIKKGLGLIVACSFLRERGWSVDAAQKALRQY